MLVRNKMLWLTILLMLGGGLGTLARYWVSYWVGAHAWGKAFPPLGTLLINVSGSFLLAATILIVRERLGHDHEHWVLFLGTGFCGGFTTFSTFEWETFSLIREGDTAWALAYIGASVLAGFVGVLAAVGTIHFLWPKS